MLHMNSIKKKLFISFGALVFFICLGFAIVSYLTSRKALSNNIDNTLSQMAKESAKGVARELRVRTNALEVLAGSDWLISNNLSIEEKLKLLESEVARSGYTRIGIVDLDGNVKHTDGTSSNDSNMEYFTQALAGNIAISDPLISSLDNSMVFIYAIPIKENNQVKGILTATRPVNALSNYTNDIKFGHNGQAYMVNSNGTVIAHQDKSLVMNMYNPIEEAKVDNDLTALADLIKLMLDGKDGVGEYTFQGQTKYMGFAPVEGTTWSLAITAPKSEIMSELNHLILILNYS